MKDGDLRPVAVNWIDSCSGINDWVHGHDWINHPPVDVWSVGFVKTETWEYIELVQNVADQGKDNEQYCHSMTIPREVIKKIVPLNIDM